MIYTKKIMYFLVLCNFLAALGCASTEDKDAVNPSVSQEEFVGGIANPLIGLMAVSGGYYHDNASWPRSLSVLQRYAEDKKKPFAAQNFRNWQVSESPQAIDTTFQIVSPASLEPSGNIMTSWKLSQDKLKPDNIALRPLSPFCILHQQPDPAGDILLRSVVSAIARQPMPPPGNRLCLTPAAGDIRTKQKQEPLEERLRSKLQRMQ